MSEKQRKVRTVIARLTRGQGNALDAIARQDRVNKSEALRRLVQREAEARNLNRGMTCTQ